MDFKRLAEQYKTELLDGVLPFWLEKSQDREFGGYFTCLDRDGSVYGTDKFIWLQGREVWMFAMLYNKVERRPEWLECAVQGAEFLRKYGHDGNYNWYFALTREGRPLVQPYNIFSYTFAAMAFAQVAVATGSDEYALIAKRTFDRILEKRANPKGEWCKAYPGTRSLKSFRPADDPLQHGAGDRADDRQTIVGRHHRGVPARSDGGVLPGRAGADRRERRGGRTAFRYVRGPSDESRTFARSDVVYYGFRKRLNRPELIMKAKDTALKMVNYGWDKEYGGLFYFMDMKGYPPQELEWDQKLWWVHIETLIAMLKGYQMTGDKGCWEWFEKIHDYTWSHFKDKEYPEWFGYLNRRGEVLLSLKGGKWKGCFHVPRGLYQCWQILESI